MSGRWDEDEDPYKGDDATRRVESKKITGMWRFECAEFLVRLVGRN
jgi:hypothetical protein